MLEQTKKISFRISSVLSKVDPEAGSWSRTFTPALAPTKKYRLRNTAYNTIFYNEGEGGSPGSVTANTGNPPMFKNLFFVAKLTILFTE